MRMRMIPMRKKQGSSEKHLHGRMLSRFSGDTIYYYERIFSYDEEHQCDYSCGRRG